MNGSIAEQVLAWIDSLIYKTFEIWRRALKSGVDSSYAPSILRRESYTVLRALSYADNASKGNMYQKPYKWNMIENGLCNISLEVDVILAGKQVNETALAAFIAANGVST